VKTTHGDESGEAEGDEIGVDFEKERRIEEVRNRESGKVEVRSQARR
jgi:hypothetical protein